MAAQGSWENVQEREAKHQDQLFHEVTEEAASFREPSSLIRILRPAACDQGETEVRLSTSEPTFSVCAPYHSHPLPTLRLDKEDCELKSTLSDTAM